MISNGAGSDTIVGRAVNPKTGEVCRGTANRSKRLANHSPSDAALPRGRVFFLFRVLERQRDVGAGPPLDLGALDLERVGAREVGLGPDPEVVDALVLREPRVGRLDQRLDALPQRGHLLVASAARRARACWA